MSHFDRIAEAAPGFEVVAHTADCPIAATQNVEKKLYAVQFHPEVLPHQERNTDDLQFRPWRMWMCRHMEDGFICQNTIEEIREQVGDGKVLLALSGGVGLHQ